MITAVNAYIEKFINTQQPIVVAYSGGLDSTVLLHLARDVCSKHFVTLRAIHVHHGLSQYADEWQQHCQDQCSKLGVQLTVAHAHIQPTPRQSLEAQARDARYQLMTEQVEPNSVVLTGQHLDDQVETFFIRLKRGSGPKGLAAMPVERALCREKNIALVRPLLDVSQATLLAYAQEHSLSWIEDESNDDQRFDRNFLRHSMMPLLNQRWPSFAKCVSRSAELCHEANMLVEEIAQQDLNQVEAVKQAFDGLLNSTLNLEALHQLTDLRQRACIRLWLEHHAVPALSASQLASLMTDVIAAKVDARPKLKLKHHTLTRYQQALYVLNNKDVLTNVPDVISWCGEQAIHVPVVNHVVYFRKQQITPATHNHSKHTQNRVSHSYLKGSTCIRLPYDDENVTIQYKVSGQLTCKPLQRNHRRSVKKLLQEYNVPPWLRSKIPFVFYNEQLVAAVGLWCCHEYAVQSNHDEGLCNTEYLEMSVLTAGTQTK